MNQYFSDRTNVPTFSLQSSDWFFLQSFMSSNLGIFDDVSTQLKAIQRGSPTPPQGATPMAVTNTYLGVILQLHYSVEMNHGKEVAKTIRNRVLAAITALEVTYPLITEYIAAVATEEALMEDQIKEFGRKNLRGKLG